MGAFFEEIEELKTQFTDQLVIVDESQPELQRFGGQTGVVRTVNMSGRALVEFNADNNIGWYDIGLDFLTVIDEPLPERPKTAKAPKAAPAAEAAASAPAAEAPKPAAPKAAAGPEMEKAQALKATGDIAGIIQYLRDNDGK